MHLFRHTEGLPAAATGGAVAIGNFDGIHLGHRAVIEQTGALARAAGIPLGVLTFEPHPRQVFQPLMPPFRLSSLRSKTHLLEELGVDCLYAQHFDLAFAKLGAEDFIDRVLVGGLKARHVVVGEDFVFGYRRLGNVTLLRQMGERHGFQVTCLPPVRDSQGNLIASRRIRELLVEGRADQAARLLGRFWDIEGRVERGDQLGRKLGFPTANVALGEHQRPKPGIYAVRAGIHDGTRMVWHDAVASLGWRPTFGGQDLRFEVHLFNFTGDLYGRHLRVSLVGYLREELKFDGAEALIAQMHQDAAQARALLATVDAGALMENSAARN